MICKLYLRSTYRVHEGDERDLPQMTESAPAGDDIIRVSKRYEGSRITRQTP